MPYVATINTPGYSPMDDDPPIFETADAAWGYLADERHRVEDDMPGAEDVDTYTETLYQLLRVADPAEFTASMWDIEWPDLVDRADRTGVIYGDTPGYDGDHDLGLAYCVTWTDEEVPE